MSKRNFLKPVEVVLATLLAVGTPMISPATTIDSMASAPAITKQSASTPAKSPLLVKPSQNNGKQASHYSHSSHASHASHSSHASHYSSGY